MVHFVLGHIPSLNTFFLHVKLKNESLKPLNRLCCDFVAFMTRITNNFYQLVLYN